MSYSTSNPPRLVTQAIAGPRVWMYSSGDTGAQVQVSGYITNGGALGMKVGDLVYSVDNDTANYVWSAFAVATVSSTYPGAVDLVNATAVTTTTNGD